MTVYGEDKVQWLAQAFKTDDSVETEEGSKKMLLEIFKNGEKETGIQLSKKSADDALERMLIEFLYARTKMNMLDKQVEDRHEVAVRKVTEVMQKMPINDFNAERVKKHLDSSRAKMESEEENV